MPTFEYVLILLSAVFIANLISRLLPALSVSVILIILGACISFLPLGITVELEPGLFFVLFIAPLIFNAGMLLDMKVFWALKGPILNMAFLLVIVSIIAIAGFLHILAPDLPLVAAFALIAALGPTDDVAIISVSERVPIPAKLMNLIKGESIINDASGIVSFQLAMLAAVSGVFSPLYAAERLLIAGIGGISAGLVFIYLKFLLVKWIRRLGMENVTLHILLELLTPFMVYMIAETVGVSGVLAVFAAGAAHSFRRKKLNPETATLHVASKSIWSVLSFTLEGVVYLILGIQLPRILRTIGGSSDSTNILELILYVIALTMAFAVMRFVWFYLTTRAKTCADDEAPVNKARNAMIFALAGARGAVTMASVLSIPVILSSGEIFPQRDLLILLATGIILCSLLISNYLLPLVVGRPEESSKTETVNQACIEILNNVISDLAPSITKENRIAAGIVLHQYRSRIKALQDKIGGNKFDKHKEQQLRRQCWEWEQQHTITLLENNEDYQSIAPHYLEVLNKTSTNGLRKPSLLQTIKRFAMHLHQSSRKGIHLRRGSTNKMHNSFIKLREENVLFILQQLKLLQEYDNSKEVRKIHQEYEIFYSFMQSRNAMTDRQHATDHQDGILLETAASAFQIERDNIQIMFETGRISREKAKELRNNIALLETELS